MIGGAQGQRMRATRHPHPPLRGTLSRSRERAGLGVARAARVHP